LGKATARLAVPMVKMKVVIFILGEIEDAVEE
jgi:hypothetical protein